MFPHCWRAGRVQPRGLEPLSAREKGKGANRKWSRPHGGRRPEPPFQLLQPSTEGNKESARSVERSEKERGRAQRVTRETLSREEERETRQYLNTNSPQKAQTRESTVRTPTCRHQLWISLVALSCAGRAGGDQWIGAYESSVLAMAARRHCSGMWWRRKYAGLIPRHVIPSTTKVFSDSSGSGMW